MTDSITATRSLAASIFVSLLCVATFAVPSLAFAQDPAPETPGERDSGSAVDEETKDGTVPSTVEGSGEAVDAGSSAGDVEAPADDTAPATDAPGTDDADDDKSVTPDTGPADAPKATRSRAQRIRRAAGFAIRVEGGQAMWSLDAEKIGMQVGNLRDEVGTMLVDRTHNAPAGILHIGFNILGHATLSAELAGTGWELFNTSRGGGGMGAGVLAWHPVELLAELIPIGLLRQRAWDVSLFGGAGWGAVGKDRAVRGLHLVMGARAEIYFSPWFALGATVRHYSLRFDEYVVHWDNDVFVELPDTSGGSLLIPSLTLTFRVPTGN